MRHLLLGIVILAIVSCQSDDQKTHDIILGATPEQNSHEKLSDDYVLVEFAAKLEEDYFRFKQMTSP